ncbi:glucose 1-dehydrogenase [Kaistia dalseonensis]|nr:glucose 1-dehydrogenase [Kaistia dalseonensis]
METLAPPPARRRLEGRVAIVTGGRRGMGHTIAAELAAEGAIIAIVTHGDLAAAEAIAGTFGPDAIAIEADITNQASVNRMVDEVVARLGRVDILVNNAGYGKAAPLTELSEDDWDAVYAVNVKGTFLCSAAVARVMMKQQSGSIVNIIAASAHRSFPRSGAYGSSKAAVVSLTQQMALEWSPFGIRVNGVSPGAIRDPETNWQEAEPWLIKEVSRLPLKRAGLTIDIAKAVAFLASDDAAYITAQTLPVDGGGVATWHLSAYLYDGDK